MVLAFLLSVGHRTLRFTVTRNNPVVTALWHTSLEAWWPLTAESQRAWDVLLVLLESTYDRLWSLVLVLCGYGALLLVAFGDLSR